MFLKEPNLSASSAVGTISSPTGDDPYQYLYGFGNHHVSEAVPGALPKSGTNMPKKCPYGLFPEHLNGTSFISSRETVSNVWMYRIKPGVAHRPLTPLRAPTQIESCFLPTNPNVCFTPLTHTWGPLSQPSDDFLADGSHKEVTFLQGLKTVAGHGDPTLKEGLAVHMYTFNADMRREAFVNNDGDLLLIPQRGSLDIQTELGYLRVRPGEIAVLPAGFRFAVRLAKEAAGVDTVSQTDAGGFALEIFGTHFILPDLGPLGANGLAHVRDFEHPVAAFEIDAPHSTAARSAPDWQITVKLAGRLYAYQQPHTPFDVVAWHGRYAPYKYDLACFGNLTANTDQLDPTAYCVLTAPTKWPGVSLVDFCVFAEKWAVAVDTIRIPYYHRTVATEMCGIIKGEYKGSVRPLEEGGLSFEGSYMPHGESYDAWKSQMECELRPETACDGFLGFMFHISSHVGLTKWAKEDHPDIRPETPRFWDNFRRDFIDHIEDVNNSLSKAGMPTLEVQPSEEVEEGLTNDH